MANYKIYEDMATRTQGDIYIGVVGPVRTGNPPLFKNLWIRWFCRAWTMKTREHGRWMSFPNRRQGARS